MIKSESQPQKRGIKPIPRVVIIRADIQGVARCYDAQSGDELTEIPGDTEIMVKVMRGIIHDNEPQKQGGRLRQ